MVATTASYFFYYSAAPDTSDNGTLVAIPYTDAGFRYRPSGGFVDRGDLKYTSTPSDWWEYDYQKGMRLTHKNGFDGIVVNLYVSGNFLRQETLVTGQIYFEAHPNTATIKTIRVEIANQANQQYLLQTGLDLWQ